MDNTKANRAALELLRKVEPEWLLLGCQAHALSLLIKDLGDAKQGKCDWMMRVYSTAIMMSNTINNSDKVRGALNTHQLGRRDGKVDAIAVHCPTRFATAHFICHDLIKSKEAIRSMVSDDSAEGSWDTVAKSSTDRETFKNAALGVVARASGRGRPARPFKFAEMEAGITLVQPVCDAIHQLEADRPLLSQMRPIWQKLLAHAAEFDAQHATELGEKVAPLFEHAAPSTTTRRGLRLTSLTHSTRSSAPTAGTCRLTTSAQRS